MNKNLRAVLVSVYVFVSLVAIHRYNHLLFASSALPTLPTTAPSLSTPFPSPIPDGIPPNSTTYPTVPANRFKTKPHLHLARRSPCYYVDEEAGRCKINLGDDLRVAVITWTQGHYSRVQIQRQTWLKDYLINETVYIVSDSEDREQKIINSGCPEGVMGISCKTMFVYRMLFERAPQAKWYLRVMDDTYVDLPRMMEYLSQFDENVPLIISKLQVISPVNDWLRYEESQGPQYRANEVFYPQGGCGWVVSNAYMKKMLQPDMSAYLQMWLNDNVDDVAMGKFTENSMEIAVLSYPGFSQCAWTNNCDNIATQCPNPRMPGGNFSFVSFHALGKWEAMQEIHRLLQRDYTATYITDTVDNAKHWWNVCPCKA